MSLMLIVYLLNFVNPQANIDSIGYFLITGIVTAIGLASSLSLSLLAVTIKK